MKKLFVLGTVAASLAIACAAYAYPTLTGGTGLGIQPNAKVVCPGTLDVAADFYNTDGTFIENTYPIRLTYGVTPNLEIGGAYFVVQDNNGWGLNAKYTNLYNVGGFNLGVGGQYANFSDADITALQGYLVGDYKIGGGETGMPAIDLTLGGNWTQVDFGPFTEDAIRGFIGIDACLAPGLSLVADYQTKNDDLLETDSAYSVALRYQIMPSLTAQAGYTNGLGNIIGTSESNYFIGLNYNFAPMAAE